MTDDASNDSWVRTVRLAFTSDSVPEVRQVFRDDLLDSLVPDDVVERTRARYIEAYEWISQLSFDDWPGAATAAGMCRE